MQGVLYTNCYPSNASRRWLKFVSTQSTSYKAGFLQRRAVTNQSNALTSTALLALLPASVGLYGVISYDVARSTHEIGIRMALGAQRRDVVGLVLRETMLMVFIGVIIGLSVALGATRLIL